MSKIEKTVNASKTVEKTSEVAQPSVGEQIWASLRTKTVSVFNLPAQPVESLVATKRVQKGKDMVDEPDVTCIPEMVFMKLKFSAALSAISDAAPELNFQQSENGQVMVTRKNVMELQQKQPQPFVVINR